MKSVMSHSFSQIPRAQIPRSSFDRSCGLKTAFDSGLLIPVFVDEALPGDTFNLKMTAFSRLSTPLHPFMDNLHLDSFFFAVPLRLVWDNFQKFNGEQKNPGDSTDFLIPTMTSPAVTGYDNETLSDYLGIPTKVPNLEHSSLWHRAYNLIYNEWFRDENLVNSAVVDTDDGPDNPADYVLRRRGKRHDYFTSCLPWPQKSDSIMMPSGDKVPVIGLGVTSTTYTAGPGNYYETGSTGLVAHGAFQTYSGLRILEDPDSPGRPGIFADTSIAPTINELRQAFQVQKLYERDARGGSRYTEIIRSHFGVISPDQRLQRPEYLGGGTSRFNINPVAQTSSTDGTSPQGNLSAFGINIVNNHGFTKSFTEHCVIIGLVSVRADLTYQQGLDRMFSRSTRFDFYWPSLSHIGEQAVLNKEIYAQGITEDNYVFGYQERYAEYRYKPSKITGKMRSNDAASLDTWHLSQEFGALPVLNQSFIEENPPISRVVAVTTEPEILFDSYFELRCARPMPVYSVPSMIDHF